MANPTSRTPPDVPPSTTFDDSSSAAARAVAAPCLALGLLPKVLAGPLVDAATGAVLGGPPPREQLALWHGFNVPFLLGMAALAGGLAVAALRRRLDRTPRLLPDATRLFQSTYDGALSGARAGCQRLHNRSLERYLVVLFGAIVLAGLIAGFGEFGPDTLAAGRPMLPVTPLAVFGWAILAVTAAGTVRMREQRLTALILASVVGLMVVLTYAHLSAPDLALTQVAVEIITTVLLLLAIPLLPTSDAPARGSGTRRLRNGALAFAVGAGAGLLAFMVMTQPRHAIVARDVLQEATQISGRNLVHLILVDFRAFDTLGEISVLMVAGLGVFALVRGFLDRLSGQRLRRHMVHPAKAWDVNPLQLVIVARLLLPLAHLVAVFLFLRGEAHPGGGFVAGLVVAVAILIQYMAHGLTWTERRSVVSYRASVAAGVLIAVLTGIGSLARGQPFLTHGHTTLQVPVIGELELGTVMLFDLGVFLTVAGATLLAMVNIGRLETRVPKAA